MRTWRTRLLLPSYAGGFMGHVGAGTPAATSVSEAELRACGHGKARDVRRSVSGHEAQSHAADGSFDPRSGPRRHTSG